MISNGIKFKSNNRNSKVNFQAIHSRNELKFLVGDNGIGIDIEKYKNQLFIIYKTFHGTQRRDSRGVGLYITKTQMETLVRTIEVESVLDVGTTFILTFKKQKIV